MDYNKTAERYAKYGQSKLWEQIPEHNQQNAEKKWKETVTSPRTGEYYQAEELINRELVPKGWEPPHVDSNGKPLKYPIKNTWEIYRLRIADGTEWLKSRQMWIGLDRNGNPVSQAMIDPEFYDDVLPIVKQVPENPRVRDSPMIRKFERMEHRIKYTLPFTPEAAQELYDMKEGPNGQCGLVIMDKATDSPPRGNVPLQDFKNRPFDELWEWATSPRMKPSTKDDNHKQYG